MDVGCLSRGKTRKRGSIQHSYSVQIGVRRLSADGWVVDALKENSAVVI